LKGRFADGKGRGGKGEGIEDRGTEGVRLKMEKNPSYAPV